MLIADIKQKALDFLLRHGSHPSVIYVSGSKADSVLILDDLPGDYLQRRKHLFVMGVDLALSQQVGVVREVFSASEAWVSLGEPEQKKHVSPSKDPKRTEALVVYSVDVVSKQQRLFMFTIVRDAQGIAREITPFHGREEQKAVSNPFLLTFLAGYASVALGKNKHAFSK